MLEDIFKLPNMKKTFERAIMVNSYIYNRSGLVNMLRRYTDKKELLRPAKTRFATAFITLGRMHELKSNLRKMFTSDEWLASKWAKEIGGKKAMEIILMPSFWNNVIYALKVAGPLVKVLRLVDGEKKPPMGYIYEAMDRAKEAIARSFQDQVLKFDGIFNIIEKRWNIQLHRPLHAAGWYLNPEFFYNNKQIAPEIVEGLYDCIKRLNPDITIQDQIDEELVLYREAQGLFGDPIAKRKRGKLTPAQWWAQYGCRTPTLQTFAIKILSLTCSSSGCERNWSVFENLHTKRRNRLAQSRLNDLVYVKYNRALRRRFQMRDTLDPISLNDIDDANEWLTGKLVDEDDTVYPDDDLTWSQVAQAAGVEELQYKFRSIKSNVASSSRVQTIDLDNEHELGDEEQEELEEEGEEFGEGVKLGNEEEEGIRLGGIGGNEVDDDLFVDFDFDD